MVNVMVASPLGESQRDIISRYFLSPLAMQFGGVDIGAAKCTQYYFPYHYHREPYIENIEAVAYGARSRRSYYQYHAARGKAVVVACLFQQIFRVCFRNESDLFMPISFSYHTNQMIEIYR